MKGSKRKFEDSHEDSTTACKLLKSHEGEISGSRSSHNVDEPSYQKESSDSSFPILNEEESILKTVRSHFIFGSFQRVENSMRTDCMIL